MLCLSMLPGEYFTIGKETVVQLDRVYSSRAYFVVNAPREIPIVRGTVLERQGGRRPECIRESKGHKGCSQVAWDTGKEKALRAMRQVVAGMEDGEEKRLLGQYLNKMFPAPRKVPQEVSSAANQGPLREQGQEGPAAP